MSAALVVAVSQRVDVIQARNERRDALDQRLCRWLAAVGCVPLPVPNVMGSSSSADWLGLQNWLGSVKPHAVILSGGNDIGEALERDNTERRLLSWAADRQAPVLGICRGMQMMSVWAGGTLKPVQGHVRTRHVLWGSLPGNVNSFHNFGLTQCPPGFDVLAKAEDGEIEAIRHTTLPWEGWMWHPEREDEFAPADLIRARAIFG